MVEQFKNLNPRILHAIAEKLILSYTQKDVKQEGWLSMSKKQNDKLTGYLKTLPADEHQKLNECLAKLVSFMDAHGEVGKVAVMLSGLKLYNSFEAAPILKGKTSGSNK